jgi:hypothetical protein
MHQSTDGWSRTYSVTGPQQWRKYESADVLGGAEDFKPIEFLAFSMELVEIRMNVVED